MADRLKIGVIIGMSADVGKEFGKVADLGLDCCQFMTSEPEHYTDERLAAVKAAIRQTGVEITALWTGFPGPAVWDFLQGPETIGLVPRQYREMRVKAITMGAEFAAKLGVPAIITHAGFIPENPKDPLYAETVEAMTKIAKRCVELGLGFWFETGQETPVTLFRAMTDIGTGNLGVNFDPANLLMYGKANPIDALDILGPHVRGVHAKDGEYPTKPNSLGVEKPLGEGRVDFPRFMAKLKSFGYTGALTIEREISGDQQIKDIKHAIELLGPLC